RFRLGQAPGAARAPGGDVLDDLAALLGLGGGAGVEEDQILEPIAPHADASGPYCARSPSLRRIMPCRIRDLTVPSGSPSRLAISLWLRSSKNDISTAR